MKLAPFIIGGAALAALGAAALIAPRPLELATMQLHDENNAGALAAFRAKFAAGQHDATTVYPMVELLSASGEHVEAARVLQTYLASHPQDEAARKRLARLFEEGRDLTEALDVLAALARDSGDPDVLRRAAHLADIAGDQNERLKLLDALVATGKATSGELSNQARLLAGAGESARALATLEIIARRYPSALSFDNVELALSLASDSESFRRGLNLALVWFGARPTPQAVLTLADGLELMGYGDIKPALARALLRTAPTARGVAAATAIVAARSGDEQALAALRSAIAQGVLPRALGPEAVRLFLERSELDPAFAAARAYGLMALAPPLRAGLLTRADEMNRRDIIVFAKDELGPDLQMRDPVLAARIAFALGREREAESLMARAAKQLNGADDLLLYAKAALDFGQAARANAALERLRKMSDQLSAPQLAEAAPLALSAKQTKFALALTEKLMRADPSYPSKFLRARALAAAGRNREAVALAQTFDRSTVSSLIAYASILAVAGERETAQKALADALLKMDPGVAERRELALALAASGPPYGASARRASKELLGALHDTQAGAEREAILALLAYADPKAVESEIADAAIANPERWAFTYLEMMKRQGQAMRAAPVLLAALENARTERARNDIVYSLMEAGAYEALLPILQDLAQNSREMREVYVEALKRLKRNAEMIAILKDELDTATPERKRAIAFELLSAGDTTDTEGVFKELTLESGPKSNDMQQLLFLWGPRPDAPAISWLRERALAADGAERAEWIKLMLDAGAARDAGATALAMLGGGYDGVLAALAMEAFAQTKDRRAIHSLAQTMLTNETQPADLLAASRAAGGAQAEAEAFALAAQAADRDSNRDTQLAAARSALALGRPKDAMRYFARYANAGGKEPQALFEYGEALTGALERGRARTAYEAGLAGLRGGQRTAENLKLQALLLIRLERIEEAKRAINEALMARPDDANLKADLAAALIDAGATDEAARLLAGAG